MSQNGYAYEPSKLTDDDLAKFRRLNPVLAKATRSPSDEEFAVWKEKLRRTFPDNAKDTEWLFGSSQ